MSRPAYLHHIGTRCRWSRRSDRVCTVVLLPQGRALLPAAAQERLGLAHVPQPIVLGSVTPHGPEVLTRHRHRRPDGWAFTRHDHTGEVSTGFYDHRSEAIESCEVEAIDGHAARLHFDDQRWQQRRPSDN